MCDETALARVARLLTEEPTESFVVVTYEISEGTLREVETISAPSAEAALLMGEIAAAGYPTVTVMCRTEDHAGVIRSVILRIFERK